jgi:hypothetical protein
MPLPVRVINSRTLKIFSRALAIYFTTDSNQFFNWACPCAATRARLRAGVILRRRAASARATVTRPVVTIAAMIAAGAGMTSALMLLH